MQLYFPPQDLIHERARVICALRPRCKVSATHGTREVVLLLCDLQKTRQAELVLARRLYGLDEDLEADGTRALVHGQVEEFADGVGGRRGLQTCAAFFPARPSEQAVVGGGGVGVDARRSGAALKARHLYLISIINNLKMVSTLHTFLEFFLDILYVQQLLVSKF